MQYRVYRRQTLDYVDGGYVQKYSVDDDYLVNNNSTINVVKKQQNTLSDVVVGDVIALIENSGAFHKGVITAVDDVALTISYKSDKELFNDNIINPYASEFSGTDNDVTVAGKFGVDVIIELLRHHFVNTGDDLKNLPILFVSEGDVLDENSNPKMLWTWDNDSINFVDLFTELFEKYNLSLSWVIDFDIAANSFESRQPKYIVTLSAVTKGGGIIKDNVDMQTITYKTNELPEATVCEVIDSESKQICYISSGINLLNPAIVTEKEYYVWGKTTDNDAYRWLSGKSDEKNMPNTNISGYISFLLRDENGELNSYTLSLNATDSVGRQIIVYDKNKNAMGYYAYPTRQSAVTFNVNNFIKVTDSQDTRTDDEWAADIKYMRVNFYSNASEVQLEKGKAKSPYDPFTKQAVFYLYEKNGEYFISTEKDAELTDGRQRVLPVKTAIASLNQSSSGTDDTTPEDVAKDKLIPSQFNQSIEIKINADSKMFDFENAIFGDQYLIINEQGTINSVFTGKKFSNDNKWITLLFGLGRQNYTDLIQIKLRKSKYKQQYKG